MTSPASPAPLPLRFITLALTLALLAPGAAHAQRASASAVRSASARATNQYTRYARAITAADSAPRLVFGVIEQWTKNNGGGLTEVMDQPDSPVFAEKIKANAALFAATQLVVDKRRGDLEAVVPPEDLARVHEQMLEPMRKMSVALGMMSKYMLMVTCEQERQLGQGCDRPQRLMMLGVVMQRAGGALTGLPLEYQQSRGRAAAMLQEHGVTLAAFPKPITE